MGFYRGMFLTGAAVAAVLVCSVAQSEPAPQQAYDVPAQELKYALRTVTRRSGLDLLAPAGALQGKQARALHGQYTLEDALKTLLAGTDLSAEIHDRAVYIRGRGDAPAPGSEGSAEGQTGIVVTGSRIEGAPIASPLIQLSQRDIIDSGQTNLGDVIRSIPQNFGGSLNPGANINTPDRTGSNIGSGSSINLRGLGGDATLTLLNGHRLAYAGAYQAIDVASIPLAALDRIEIVADGASALYGSDAVAGVANVVLKRDFQGVSTTARLGASTDGGNTQQQYDLVGGTTWHSGGFLLAYDFTHTTPLLARERSYTADVTPGLTLLPVITQHNAVFTGHQDIIPDLSFSIDAFYNHRVSNRAFALTAAGNPAVDGETLYYREESLSIAPSLHATLGGWTVNATGVYSWDKSYYRTDYLYQGTHMPPFAGCYCNAVSSAELNADGTLFQLPAGPVKGALGAGYRATNYHAYRTQGAAQSIDETQNTYYAFGEVSLPLVSADQNIPLVHSLTLSAAARFEDYAHLARVLTPKFGLIYAPSSDVDIKATWGRSFKAPTFYERYSSEYTDYDLATAYGGTNLPAGATTLVLYGGNPSLKPERAMTWSVTVAVHPRSISGLRAEISYFNVNYTGRIVQPVYSQRRALSDPRSAAFVAYNPSAAMIAEAIGSRVFTNYTDTPYDPSTIAAIVYDNNLNAASQKIDGVDASVSYALPIGSTGSMLFSGNGSYIHSSQQLSADQPRTQLAGTFLNPPHFRGRGGVTWRDRSLTLSSYANYTGGIRDTRTATGGHTRAMTTIDGTARYVTPDGRALTDGLELTLSVLNLFNRKPSYIPSIAVYDLPYDPLNNSPVGRFVSLTIGKHW